MSIFKRDRQTKLERERDAVLDTMNGMDPSTEEYSAMAKNLVQIMDALSKDKERKIDWTPIISGGVALLQIVIILKYEELNVISTKAFSFVGRGRV